MLSGGIFLLIYLFEYIYSNRQISFCPPFQLPFCKLECTISAIIRLGINWLYYIYVEQKPEELDSETELADQENLQEGITIAAAGEKYGGEIDEMSYAKSQDPYGSHEESMSPVINVYENINQWTTLPQCSLASQS